MILVDNRAGSEELIKPLLKWGLPVESTRLEFGDVAFIGRGEKGRQEFVGIEHKKVPDLVQSLRNGRLQGHQLPGMLRVYDRCWLVVEGDWQQDPDGHVSMFKARGKRRPVKGAPPAVELEKQILTLDIRGGFHVRHCPTRPDTVRFLFALYRWWTDKDLDQHRTHLAIHAPDMDAQLGVEVSDFRRVVAQIPGIGLVRSGAVELAFGGSFRKMMVASEAQWANIRTTDGEGKSRRIGELTARKILETLK